MPHEQQLDEGQSWFTAEEAARYVRVTRNTIYRWSDAGLLAYSELPTGRGRRFRREDLDALLRPGRPDSDQA